MPDGDREVFDYFRSAESTSAEIDYLAFASYSYDKFDWMDHFEGLNGRSPTAEEVQNWVRQLPPARLDEMREWAETFFDRAARAYLESEIKKRLDRQQRSGLLASVRDTNIALQRSVKDSNQAVAAAVERSLSLRNTWLSGVVIGVASSAAFAILIYLASLIYTHDPSPIALIKHATAAGH